MANRLPPLTLQPRLRPCEALISPPERFVLRIRSMLAPNAQHELQTLDVFWVLSLVVRFIDPVIQYCCVLRPNTFVISVAHQVVQLVWVVLKVVQFLRRSVCRKEARLSSVQLVLGVQLPHHSYKLDAVDIHVCRLRVRTVGEEIPALR